MKCKKRILLLALLLFSTVLIGGMNVQAKEKDEAKVIEKSKRLLWQRAVIHIMESQKPAVTVKLGKKKLKKTGIIRSSIQK